MSSPRTERNRHPPFSEFVLQGSHQIESTLAYCRRRVHLVMPGALPAGHGEETSDISKYTGQSVRPADYSLNDLESNRLAGIFRVIWSNLCTRHIPDKLIKAARAS